MTSSTALANIQTMESVRASAYQSTYGLETSPLVGMRHEASTEELTESTQQFPVQDYFRMTMTSKRCAGIHDTPVISALKMSQQLGCQISIKDETTLPGRSHIYRGVYNHIAHLNREVSWQGVIAYSTGNEGECVASAGYEEKLPVIIVMPVNTPTSQQNRIRLLRATVVLAGKDRNGARKEAERLTKLHDLCLIPAMSEAVNLAGIGNVGVELGRQFDLHDVYAVFVPLGSGELVAGVGFYVRRVAPEVKIIATTLSDRSTTTVVTPHTHLLANSTTSNGQMKEESVSRHFSEMIDEVIQVTAEELSTAIQDCFEAAFSLVKPSGAISLAGLRAFSRRRPEDVGGRRLVAIVSDGATTYDEVESTMAQVSGTRA